MEGICALCRKQSELQESHVLPAFAYRWLRNRSGPNGHIRFTENVNRRVQDGIKFHWLCIECEGRFGRSETMFANKIFHAWKKHETKITYDRWLLKFCVSVSWRILNFCRGKNPEAEYSAEQILLMDKAEAKWRSFLLDECEHPAEFEQHLLVFDIFEETNIPNLPENINRFMTGVITMDIVGSHKSLMTWGKLGKFQIFGFIQRDENKWVGSKVHVRQGTYPPAEFILPSTLIPLFKEKANSHRLAMDGLSETQAQKINSNVLSKIDEFGASEQFEAILADAKMFGLNSVIRKK